MPGLLEIPVSLVICVSLDDFGHGHSWTQCIFFRQTYLAHGGDEDPIPPDGVMHPMPFAPFGGIWNDAEFVDNENHHAAPASHHAPEARNEDVPMVHTPPSTLNKSSMTNLSKLLLRPLIPSLLFET